jgi:predicted outer membrane repeat protein
MTANRVKHNNAATNGGGVYFEQASGNVINWVFVDNSGYRGGAMAVKVGRVSDPLDRFKNRAS